MTNTNFNQKQLLGRFVLFTFLWAICLKSTNAQCTDVGCIDCFNWCSVYSEQYCHVGAIRMNCRKSCKTCPTNAPACLELNCGQRCILSSDGSSAQCACEDGYELDADGRTCNDIDECAISSTLCLSNTPPENTCKNLDGGYICVACKASDPNRIGSYYQKTECCLRNHFDACGKSSTNAEGRVVQGKNSKVAKWPWTAYLRIGRDLCGGTLITRRHLLTAAHCVWKISSDSLNLITVLLGVTNVSDASNVHIQTRNVSRIFIHPNYSFPLNDIAILELSQPATTTSKYVNSICLSDGEEPQPGEVCYASGYGATSYGGNVAQVLQEVDLPIVDGTTCERAYQNQTNRVDATLHICAGYSQGGKDTCQGDSGGPLVCQRCRNCDWYLAGITAFGRECAKPGFYGVFTRTRHFEKWITDITNQRYVAGQQHCVKASWHQWGPWTSCSTTCGVGDRTRIRFCVNGNEGNPGCIGSSSETTQCNAVPCVEWAQWSSCSTSCGIGEQTRVRRGDSQSRACNLRQCPTWSAYGAWSACSQSCGGGIRRSTRVCLNNISGGNRCPGTNQRTEDCNNQCCPHWSDFGPYSDCPLTCGGAFQIASRTCECASPDGSGCEGESQTFRLCATNECPAGAVAEFSQWSSFGPCSATCNGERQRIRTCSVFGQCVADEHGLATEERESCNTGPCNAGWTSWQDSGSCSYTCGEGTITQTRSCNGGTPGGALCPGASSRATPCNLGACPAEWGPYSPFSSCSVTCGGGTQYRTRECYSGESGTGNCLGPAREERNCNQVSCSDETGTDGPGETGTGGPGETGTGVQDCSSLPNLRDAPTCCRYASLGYCDPTNQYAFFMAVNCAKTCCEYTPGQSCENSGCKDVIQQATCKLLVLVCNSNAIIQQGCKASCGLC